MELSIASVFKPSISLLLLFLTILIIPFLAFSTSWGAHPAIASTLSDSVFGILTSSPFYFFLLNILIVALVFSSGVLNPSSSRPSLAPDQDPQSYLAAAQILHERLALDELYGFQVSSLPYVRYTEPSRLQVAATDPVISNVYADKDEDVISATADVVGNPVMSNVYNDDLMGNQILTLLDLEPGLSDADDSCSALEEGDELAANTEAGSVMTDGYVREAAEIKKEGEGNTVIDDVAFNEEESEGGVRDAEDDGRSVKDAEDDSGRVDNNEGDRKEEEEDDTGEMNGDEADDDDEADGNRGRNLKMAGKEEEEEGILQKQKEVEEEEEEELSREELNERASAFITAFRRKLILTANEDHHLSNEVI